MILADLKAVPDTDPSDIIRLRDSIYAADLLITAVGRIDFFSWLDNNPSDFDAICSGLNIIARPADVMLTYFRSLNLVSHENGLYRITDLAKEHLTNDSPWSLVPYISTQTERPIVEKMYDVLKTGKPAAWGAKKDELDWEQAMEKDEFADMFTAGMDSRGAFYAPALAGNFNFSNYDSLLDIAGASGIYASAISAKYPDMKSAVFEKPPVDILTKRAIENRKLQDKINVYKGDMFIDDFPPDYDVHLYSHVLHDWDNDHNCKLIEKSYRSLNHGGIIMIHDAHVNIEKNGPLSVAEYSVLLMFSTVGKCYSVKEINDMLHNAGFINIKFIPSSGNRSIITGEKPK